MPVVNPGIRRFLGSAIQRLFNSASFYAPLTHSLVPERGTGSPTFTRATTATVMGYGPTDNAVDGLKLLTVAANEARFVGARRISEGVWSNTFADGSLIPAATNTGYLAEGARTNLCTYSQDLSNAAWTTLFAGTGIAPVVTGNFAAAPDGTMTATRVQLNKGAGATTGDYAVIRGATITGLSNPHTCAISVYAKLNTGSSASVLLGGSQNPTGVITVTDEWQRLDVVGQGVFTSNNVDIYLRGSLGSSDTADLLLWGAQVELGSFASSYIATTTIAVTRNVDVESVSTSGNIAAAAGSIYLEYTPTHTPSGTIALWGTYVDASNYTAILHDATNLIFRKRIAGSNYDATIANAFVSGTTYKVAATWGAAGTAIYLDGVAGTPHANTTAAQIAATMQVGADGNSLQQPGAGTTNLRIWQRQLSSPEGVAVTA